MFVRLPNTYLNVFCVFYSLTYLNCDAKQFQIPKNQIKVGLICAAIFQDQWHRAKIVEVIDDSEVTVSGSIRFRSVIRQSLKNISQFHTAGSLCGLWNNGIDIHIQPAIFAQHIRRLSGPSYAWMSGFGSAKGWYMDVRFVPAFRKKYVKAYNLCKSYCNRWQSEFFVYLYLQLLSLGCRSIFSPDFDSSCRTTCCTWTCRKCQKTEKGFWWGRQWLTKNTPMRSTSRLVWMSGISFKQIESNCSRSLADTTPRRARLLWTVSIVRALPFSNVIRMLILSFFSYLTVSICWNQDSIHHSSILKNGKRKGTTFMSMISLSHRI